jgi:hypothetical protein
MTNFDQRLRDAGINPEDVTTRMQSADSALLLTSRELVLLEADRIQRARLREITGVKIIKTGELNVRSASEMLIEGNVLAFEKTERKMFFDAVKDATATAKASVTGGMLPAPALLEPPLPEASHINPPVSPALLTSSAEDWRALTSTPPETAVPIFDPIPFEPSTPSSSQPEVAPFTPSLLESSSSTTSDWDDPLTSERTLAPEVKTDDPDDPWTSAKQTFEVEPEKPAESVTQDSWTSPVTDPDAGWNDVFDNKSDTSNQSTSSGVATGAALGMVASSGDSDWGGDTLDAAKALSPEKSALERQAVNSSGDNTATMMAVSRWLKIMAVLFFLSGAAFTATLFPDNASDLLGYFVLLAALFGSILFSLIAWGVSELLSAYASNVQDLRAIRRATLGH